MPEPNKQHLEALLGQAREARRGERYETASRLASQALALARDDLDDWMPPALNLMAQLSRDLGQHEVAVEHYTELAQCCEADGDDRGLAHAVRHIADIHSDEGRFVLAASGYQLALTLYRRSGGTRTLELANTLRGQALLYTRMDEPDTAMDLWLEASELYDALGITAGVEECEHRMGALERRHRGT